MKILLFLLTPFLFFAQQTTEKKDELFVALYTIGNSWDASKAPNEQAYFREHSSFLRRLRNDETITMGARYGDTGMVVFNASDLKAAEAIIKSDTAIQKKLFEVEVHRFEPFHKGCIE